MTDNTEADKAGSPRSPKPAESREERLSAALRQNLKRQPSLCRIPERGSASWVHKPGRAFVQGTQEL